MCRRSVAPRRSRTSRLPSPGSPYCVLGWGVGGFAYELNSRFHKKNLPGFRNLAGFVVIPFPERSRREHAAGLVSRASFGFAPCPERSRRGAPRSGSGKQADFLGACGKKSQTALKSLACAHSSASTITLSCGPKVTSSLLLGLTTTPKPFAGSPANAASL